MGGGSTMREHLHWSLDPQSIEKGLFLEDIIGFPDGTIWYGCRVHDYTFDENVYEDIDGFQVFYTITPFGLKQTSNWEHYKDFAQFVGVGEKTFIDRKTELIE